MKKETERKIDRRSMVKSTGVALAGLLAASCAKRKSTTKKEIKGKQMAMVIDLRKCYGCQSCAVACKAENGVRLGGFRSWVSSRDDGEYPKVTRHFLPRLCNHCQKAWCLKVCPTGATHRRDDGLVLIDKTKCIGCRHCMGACPFNARYFNPGHDPKGEKRFPSLTHGTVDKCTFCYHRVDNGVVPSCVNTCPARARIFGDLNDPSSEVSRLLVGKAVNTLLPEFGTKPVVFYIGANPNLFSEEANA